MAGQPFNREESKMKCMKCGADNEETAKICTGCGASLEDGQQAAEETAAGDGGVTQTSAEETTAGDGGVTQTSAEEAPVQAPAEEAPAQEAPVQVSLKKPEGRPEAGQPEMSRTEPAAQAIQPGMGEPEPNKKFLKILFAVVAVVAVIAVAALAYVKMTAKDPKQVVIDAFENIYPEGQVSPMEELFGISGFKDTIGTVDSEGGLTLKLDSCSDPTVNTFVGSGFRLEGKDDVANSRTSFNMGIIYNGMDLANLNGYYGEDTLMMAVPELSSKVFTIGLGEGLADRVKASPTVGPLLQESGVDVDGLATYFTELIDETEQAKSEGKEPFDIEALIDRYKNGCKAQEDFKAAMTVTRSGKETYTMDGAEVKCKGYDVAVSKDSMVAFLRTSSDFFLQDETLKADFLRQLEATVKMSELMGGAVTGAGSMSAETMQEQTYDEAKKGVDDMITYLDKTLTDVQMTVYVDKKGRLAAVVVSTKLNVEDPDTGELENVDVAFDCQLQGGTYLTQNMKANVTLSDTEDTISLDLLKKGTYDGKMLTNDVSVDLALPDERYNATCSNTYSADDGSYHASLGVTGDGMQYVDLSVSGAVDQLEKGKSVHVNIDALEASIMNASVNVVLSGEYHYGPLTSEVTPLEGEQMDVLSATMDDWNGVITEAALNIVNLAGQLGIPMY